MDKPAKYRVRVQGFVPDSWTDRLGTMTIVETTLEGMTLEGQLPDQSALAGVLDTLLTLHLPILEVIRLQENRSGFRNLQVFLLAWRNYR